MPLRARLIDQAMETQSEAEADPVLPNHSHSTNNGNSWETSPTHSGLISVKSHSLFASVSGPSRHTNLPAPIIIVFPGTGDPIPSWVAVERLISAFARILLYDRSGLGQSEIRPPEVPIKHAAVLAAEELCRLLDAAEIPGPYILVVHSAGGIIAREFLELRNDDVAGMVMVDASQERQSQYFKIPDENLVAVQGQVNFATVTGLRADAVLSREEWRARAISISRGMEALKAEAGAFVEVCETLGKKKQFEGQIMGERPVCVIRANSARDFWRIWEEGVRVGNGTVEQQAAFRELLGRWDEVDEELQMEQLRLSKRTRYVRVEGCGHNVQLVRPDVVADGVQWVLRNLVGG